MNLQYTVYDFVQRKWAHKNVSLQKLSTLIIWDLNVYNFEILHTETKLENLNAQNVKVNYENIKRFKRS